MFDISVMEKTQVVIAVDKELKQKHLDEIIKNVLDYEPIKTFIIIDLSLIIWIELDAVLWFISFLNRLKTRGNDIKIILPDPETHSGRLVWDYLITWKFFDALKECVDSPVNLLEISQLKYINTIKSNYRATPTERRTITDDYGTKYPLPNRLLEIETINNDNYSKGISEYKENFAGAAWAAIRNYCAWNDDDTSRFVNTVVEEGLINSFVHGENTFTNVAIKSDEKNLILAICDNGKGIPTSLRETFNKKKDLLAGKDYSDEVDSFLLNYFTKSEMIIDSLLIDQSTHENQGAIGRKGDGLFYLKDFVFKHKGKLRIRSGRAWVGFECIDNKEIIDSIDHLLQSPGTLITIILPRIR